MAPYLLAMPYLSGIICIMTSGIVMSYYVTPNLSEETKLIVSHTSKILAYLSETLSFLYIGMAVFVFPMKFNGALIGFVMVLLIHCSDSCVQLFCILGRFLNIVPLTILANIFRRKRIGVKDTLVLIFSGLRGPVSFAVSLNSISMIYGDMLFTTTCIIV